MDSSDEDFLPDPDKPGRGSYLMERGKKPPDKPVNQPRGKKRTHEEDSTKGKCFFSFLSDQ